MNTTKKNSAILDTPVLAGAIFVLGATIALPSLAGLAQGSGVKQVKTDTVSRSGSRPEFDATTIFVEEQVRNRLPLEYSKNASTVAMTLLKESRRHGFDPLMILAVIQHESKFSPTIVGSAGEIGLMQIKPSTAEWLHKSGAFRMPASMPVFDWKKTLADPASNVRVGISYLAMLRDRFPSGGGLYLAAYNMGASKLNQKLSQKQRPRIYASKVLGHYLSIYAQYRRTLSQQAQSWNSANSIALAN